MDIALSYLLRRSGSLPTFCSMCPFHVPAGDDEGGELYRCRLLTPEILKERQSPQPAVGLPIHGQPKKSDSLAPGLTYRPVCKSADWYAAATTELDRLIQVALLNREAFALLSACQDDPLARAAFDDYIKENE